MAGADRLRRSRRKRRMDNSLRAPITGGKKGGLALISYARRLWRRQPPSISFFTLISETADGWKKTRA